MLWENELIIIYKMNNNIQYCLLAQIKYFMQLNKGEQHLITDRHKNLENVMDLKGTD